MDLGLTLTAVACALGLGWAVRKQRDLTLPVMLAALWGASVGLSAAGAKMATFVFTAVMMNLLVGFVALLILIREPNRADARFIGGLAMAIMPAHFIMSATNGQANWTIYAWSCNIVYILQCLVAGGWLDWLGRSLGGIITRLRPVRGLRDGEA
jgi:hypothetical protein